MSMNLNDLKTFLIDSNNAGFSGGNEKKWIKENDGSTTIPFEKGDWKSHDNFFGGEPYGGRLVVFYKNKAVWIMVYYGWIEKGMETEPIYKILKDALKKMPAEAPFRGPKNYSQGDFVYSNNWEGEVGRYLGEEQITQNGKLVFKTNYFGGMIDQENGV